MAGRRRDARNPPKSSETSSVDCCDCRDKHKQTHTRCVSVGSVPPITPECSSLSCPPSILIPHPHTRHLCMSQEFFTNTTSAHPPHSSLNYQVHDDAESSTPSEPEPPLHHHYHHDFITESLGFSKKHTIPSVMFLLILRFPSRRRLDHRRRLGMTRGDVPNPFTHKFSIPG